MKITLEVNSQMNLPEALKKIPDWKWPLLALSCAVMFTIAFILIVLF